MRVVFDVSKFYEWAPVPDGVAVTPLDIKNMRVKPASAAGGWLMRVEKTCDTQTTVIVPEHAIIENAIQEMTRGDKQTMTRKQLIARHLSRHVMGHMAHKSWMNSIAVDDDGPSEELFRAKLAPHVEAGNIDAADVEGMVAAYMETATPADYVDHLHNHFDIKKDKAS